MAYTAFESMRKANKKRFGREVGPFEPALSGVSETVNDLRSASLRFLHNSCEGLRFGKDTAGEFSGNLCTGRGLKACQIPYDFQMDIDRLCLERELGNFIDSGIAEDAYTVYYCFLEMFMGSYGTSHNMIELLSEFESNASALLMKHRDHYLHSVYVFALGLAIYETSQQYREIFRRFYRKQIGFRCDEPEESKAHRTACFFLKYWGFTSLFHDIGYPFEIPFEQVMSYFETDHTSRGKDTIYPAYLNVEALTTLKDCTRERFRELYRRDFRTIDELLAFDITSKLGAAYDFDEAYMLEKLKSRPSEPQNNYYYMDHAYFSSARLCREIADAASRAGGPGSITAAHVDVLSAIVMHNSLFKFDIALYRSSNRKPGLKAELHPLAYLLMLCDELQCWDRIAYGRNTRTELHPMSADFDFTDGKIHVVYYYDEQETGKNAEFRKKSDEWEKKVFVTEIRHIVDTSIMPLDAVPDVRHVYRGNKQKYLSGSSFLHLYDFAVAINGRYLGQDEGARTETEQLERFFDEMSLEYKLSNIHQAKGFDRYLNVIGCFYTDRPVDFDMLTAFTQEELDTIAPLEHERWVREHISMGWSSGDDYENIALNDAGTYGLSPDLTEKEIRLALREQMRRHKHTMDGNPTVEEIRQHYDQLEEADQGKDWKPMECMLSLLRKYDGLRIYRFEPLCAPR